MKRRTYLIPTTKVVTLYAAGAPLLSGSGDSEPDDQTIIYPTGPTDTFEEDDTVAAPPFWYNWDEE